MDRRALEEDAAAAEALRRADVARRAAARAEYERTQLFNAEEAAVRKAASTVEAGALALA